MLPPELSPIAKLLYDIFSFLSSQRGVGMNGFLPIQPSEMQAALLLYGIKNNVLIFCKALRALDIHYLTEVSKKDGGSEDTT